MRISDWSSDVCSSDLQPLLVLDDIDAVADQRDWALALLRLIDRRRADGYSFLLSASAPPEPLPVALPDLRTPLAACVVLGLLPLDDDARAALLNSRAHARGLPPPAAVQRWLLKTHTRTNWKSDVQGKSVS